jgi:ABC-type transporter Mla subunit MlaD
MISRRQDFVLGLVVLTFIGLLVGTVLFIYPSLGVATRQVVAQFRHDQGVAPVQVASPVMLSGALRVGTVTGVTKRLVDLGPGEGGESLMIVVAMDVDSDLTLYEDCEIATDQPPVGGAGGVVIRNVGTPGRAPIAGGHVIMGQPAQSLAATIGGMSRRVLGDDGLLDKLDWLMSANERGSLVFKLLATLDDVKTMTGTLSRELSPADQRSLLGKIHVTLDNVSRATEAIAGHVSLGDDPSLVGKVVEALDRLNQGLDQTIGILEENRPVVRDTLQSLEQITERINSELLQQLAAELDRANPDSLMGKVHASMDDLGRSLENVSGMTDAGKTLILANKPPIDRLLDNLLATSRTLKQASDELRAAPWRLLYKPPGGERAQNTVFDAARAFAEAALNLDDTTARLEAIMTMSEGQPADAHVEEVRRIQASLQKAFERFEQAETFLWEQMK